MQFNTFSFKKMCLKLSSANVGRFCLSLNKQWVCTITFMTSHERHCVSDDRQLDCFFSRLFRLRTKQTSKLRYILVLCEVNPPITGGFPSQRTSSKPLTTHTTPIKKNRDDRRQSSSLMGVFSTPVCAIKSPVTCRVPK